MKILLRPTTCNWQGVDAMLSFIRYDFKKLFMMRALPIFFILVLLPTVILSALEYYQGYGQSYDQYEVSYEEQLRDHQESQNSDQEMEEDGLHISVVHPGEKMDEATYQAAQAEAKESLSLDQSSFDTMIYLAPLAIVFFAIFIGNDFSSGFLKNLLSLKDARRNWVLAKIPTALVFGLIVLLASLAFGLYTHVMAGLAWKNLEWTSLFLQFIMLELYLVITILLANLLALLSQSKSLTIVMGLLIGSGMIHSLLVTIGSYFDLNLNHLFFLRRMEAIGLEADKGFFSLALLGGVYLIILLSLNLIRIKRMDFKFAS